MFRERSDQAFLVWLAIADVLAACVAWLLAYVARWEIDLIPPANNEVPPWWWCIRTLPTVIVAAAFSFRISGMYQLRRRWNLFQEFIRAFQASGLLLLLVLATTFYSRNPYESRAASLLFFVFTLISLVAIRRSLGAYFRWCRRQGRMRGHAIIVGTGRTARAVEESLVANNWLGIQPVGFVEDQEGSNARSVPTVGTVDDLPRLVEEHDISFVFVALPLRRFSETKKIFRLLSGTLVDIRLVPDVPQLATMSVQVDEIEGLPILKLRASHQGMVSLIAKRGMDILGGIVGLVIFAPVMAVIAILVKCSDGGPILYFQERMGLNGRRFRMIKFRTMRVGAESETGPVWAKPGDDRRTGLGSFLRESSLDELPQFWNVLRGEMSLVGPRPERPHFINKFRQSIPRYMLRHAVKAGMTGWAQVNGWRGNTSLRKRVQYDLYYISNWSIWLDIRIIILTFLRVLRDRNAY